MTSVSLLLSKSCSYTANMLQGKNVEGEPSKHSGILCINVIREGEVPKWVLVQILTPKPTLQIDGITFENIGGTLKSSFAESECWEIGRDKFQGEGAGPAPKALAFWKTKVVNGNEQLVHYFQVLLDSEADVLELFACLGGYSRLGVIRECVREFSFSTCEFYSHCRLGYLNPYP